MKTQLHVILCALLIAPSLQQSTANNNAQFDPENASIDTCSIPKYQQEGSSYVPPDTSVCAPSRDGVLTDARIQQLANAYAPILFFHPLEPFTMQSVDETFRDPSLGKIFFGDEVVSETLNQTFKLLSVRDLQLALNSHLYSFGHELTKPYLAGAGFDEEGKARAPIYYNAFEYDANSIVINYHFYYTYHDAATFGVVGSHRGDTYYSNFRTIPFGAHEGDWQGMSVMVCKSAVVETDTTTTDTTATTTVEPLAVAYKQYQSREVTDCTAGECTLYKDTVRPVGFVARGTHSTYPVTTTNMVFSELEVEFFVDLQAVLAVDKTNFKARDGSYRIFDPDATNVVKILEPADVDFNTVPESQYWQAFGGRWGCTCLVLDPDLELNLTSPGPSQCFNGNGTEYTTCPDPEDLNLSTFYLVNHMLGVQSSVDTAAENARALIGNVLQFFSIESPFGPATFPEFHRWLPPVNSPVRKQTDDPSLTAEAYCQKLVSISDEFHTPIEYDTVALKRNVWGLIAFGIFVMITTMVAYTHPRFCSLRKARPIISMDEHTGVAQKPDRATAVFIFGPAIGYAIFYVVTIVGVILYFYGYRRLSDLMRDTLGMDISSVDTLSYLFGIAVVIIDSVMVIFIWFPTRTIWRQVNMAYYDLIGDDEMLDGDKKKKRIRCCVGKTPLIWFQFMYGVLFNSMILSVLTVLIGCIYVGMAYSFGEICVNLIGSIDNACLDLQAWGIIIECGPDFQSFCSSWASSDSITTLWGSFIIVAGHYYLIGEVGAASKMFRSVPNSLFLLPSRSVYLARIARLGGVSNSDNNNDDDNDDNNDETAGLVTGAHDNMVIGGDDDDDVNGAAPEAAAGAGPKVAGNEEESGSVGRASVIDTCMMHACMDENE